MLRTGAPMNLAVAAPHNGVYGVLKPAAVGLLTVTYFDTKGALLASHLLPLGRDGAFNDRKTPQDFASVQAIWMGNPFTAPVVVSAAR